MSHQSFGTCMVACCMLAGCMALTTQHSAVERGEMDPSTLMAKQFQRTVKNATRVAKDVANEYNKGLHQATAITNQAMKQNVQFTKNVVKDAQELIAKPIKAMQDAAKDAANLAKANVNTGAATTRAAIDGAAGAFKSAVEIGAASARFANEGGGNMIQAAMPLSPNLGSEYGSQMNAAVTSGEISTKKLANEAANALKSAVNSATGANPSPDLKDALIIAALTSGKGKTASAAPAPKAASIAPSVASVSESNSTSESKGDTSTSESNYDMSYEDYAM